jgi:hypothetical protein
MDEDDDDDDDLSIGMAIAVVAVHVVIAVIAMTVWVSIALIILVVDFSLARGWRWLPFFESRALGSCAAVRAAALLASVQTEPKRDALSEKCENHIDKWLRVAPRMSCPICEKTPRPVLPRCWRV